MTDFVSSFLGLFSMQGAQAEAEINTRLSKVRADANNTVRQASNVAAAAQGSLARFIQSVNNNRRLKAGGQALEANVVNFLRSDDQLLKQGLSLSVQEAEQAGAAAAAAAVNGIGGSVVDDVNLSTNLRAALIEDGLKDMRSTEAYDTSRRAGSIMSQMVGSLDQSLILDAIDYNQDVAQITARPGGRGLQAALLLARAGAAIYTGGQSEAAQAAKPAFSWNTATDSGDYFA